jgi:hypothetical protein
MDPRQPAVKLCATKGVLVRCRSAKVLDQLPSCCSQFGICNCHLSFFVARRVDARPRLGVGGPGEGTGIYPSVASHVEEEHDVLSTVVFHQPV